MWADQGDTQGCSTVGDQAVTLGRVAVGAKRTVKVSGLQAGTAGAKALRAFADGYCGTWETREGNNQKTAAYTVGP